MWGYIWVAHNGAGAPYVAIDYRDAPKTSQWSLRQGNSLPGVDPKNQPDEISRMAVAEADKVGVVLDRRPGCFQLRFGQDGMEAERGIPTYVNLGQI